MNRQVLVYADLEQTPVLVGRLWARERKGRQSASFEYDASWLKHPQRFALEPGLAMGPGHFHTAQGRMLFGALGDSAPDRWGRLLMKRAERQLAKSEGRQPRALSEIDFLLRVNDSARQGALRFTESEGGPFLTESTAGKIPPLVKLPRLLAASETALEDDADDDFKLLLAPGSSLGGARPKASVRDTKGNLLIAKFPSKEDEYRVLLWEAVALSLAKKAKAQVPEWRLHQVSSREVLLLKRFDRDGERRIPFLSAMSMLGADDGEARCYLEFVDVLRRHGAAPKADCAELWRRVVLSILISNTDDHLRNHGFLYAGSAGWRLSPLYDINPVPTDIRPRVLSTEIQAGDATASLETALAVADYFQLQPSQAKVIALEVGQAVLNWRQEAAKVGLSKSEVERMASAFEHRDLEMAVGK